VWCLLVTPISAGTVWTLQGVTFTDGGTASGSFVYDVSTNTYSNINIATTAGSILTGATYQFVNVHTSNASGVGFLTSAALDQTGDSGLALFFSSPLNGSGGTATIRAISGEGTCGNPTCVTFTPLRNVNAGNVSAPEPLSMLFFLSGLAAVVLIGRIIRQVG
jgi:hypothetical protein